MAILAVSEGGLPACRKTSRRETAVRFQADASRRGSHRRMLTHEGRENAGMGGDHVKQRSNNFSDTKSYLEPCPLNG